MTITTPPTPTAPAPGVVQPPRWTRARRLLTLTLAAMVLGALLTAGAWRLEGGLWFSVRTPSMGVAAPVGTLVLTRPVTVDDLAVGDVITFHPPAAPTETYTHRVITIGRAGAGGASVITQGDINGAPDPWTVHQGDILGRVTARWWAMGWAVQALPLLVLGGTLGWVLTRFVRSPRWRSPARIVGSAALAGYTAQSLHPFLGVTQIAAVTDAGTTRISLVSTGILPIRVSTSQMDGTALDLRSGQTGVLQVHTGNSGRLDLATGLHMPPSWWVVLVAIWLIPLLYTLIVGVPRTAPRDEVAS